MNDIVAATDLSRRDLEKAFRQELKHSPNEELIRVRMDEARKLLETSTLKAVEISAKTGFSRSNHFFRTFRRFVGTSPKIYRKRLKARARKSTARLRK